jgi:hypothetical protein
MNQSEIVDWKADSLPTTLAVVLAQSFPAPTIIARAEPKIRPSWGLTRLEAAPANDAGSRFAAISLTSTSDDWDVPGRRTYTSSGRRFKAISDKLIELKKPIEGTAIEQAALVGDAGFGVGRFVGGDRHKGMPKSQRRSL